MFAAVSIFLLKDGKLDMQEDWHDSFRLGSGHDSILQFGEREKSKYELVS
jgi:hypothetical protein